MFRPGDTVIFDAENLSPVCWSKLDNLLKIKHYGQFGVGSDELKLFTFITYHYPQVGHCTLMDMDTGQLLPMCHDSNFRLVTDEEC